MKGRTKKLGVIGAVAVIGLSSGAVIAHAVATAGPEGAVDCLIFNGGVTGQNICPHGVQIKGTNSQVFHIGVGSGSITTDCHNGSGTTGPGVFSTISPTFATLQGLGPYHVQTPQFNDTPNFAESNVSQGSGAGVTFTATSLTDPSKNFTAGTNAAVDWVNQTVEVIDTSPEPANPIFAWSGTVMSVTSTVITLTAAGWTPYGFPTTPATPSGTATMKYQVMPCTDTLGGHTMTVTTNGWAYLEYDCLATYPGDTGTGGTVTYGANTLTDSSKSWTTNQWANADVKVGVQEAIVLSNTATTLTLKANWTPTPPTAGSTYNLHGDVGGCTSSDEGSPEGTAGTDTVGIRVPVDGAVVYEDLAQCDIKVNPTGTAKYEVNASTNDKDLITVAGTVGGPATDPASNIPLSVTGTATCPTALTKAAYTGTLSFFDNTTPTVVSPITDG
jgi:hypothetical protein